MRQPSPRIGRDPLEDAKDIHFCRCLVMIFSPRSSGAGKLLTEPARQVDAMRDEYRTIDVLRRDREAELVDLRKKLNAGDFTAAEQVRFTILAICKFPAARWLVDLCRTAAGRLPSCSACGGRRLGARQRSRRRSRPSCGTTPWWRAASRSFARSSKRSAGSTPTARCVSREGIAGYVILKMPGRDTPGGGIGLHSSGRGWPIESQTD